jgi:hypothetical protein
MNNPNELPKSISFIVKFWIERNSHTHLRGRITQVNETGTDQQQTVTHLNDITEFIGQSLAREGLRPNRMAQIKNWFARHLRQERR